ncbi:hypothetical protein AB1L30_05270 [Bremerella sp. JC817]|uniref:hypothetical protein n=1 Tax=Bremerella sp. JC817 TaxID=3231756 RepID=UPI00345B3ECE
MVEPVKVYGLKEGHLVAWHDGPEHAPQSSEVRGRWTVATLQPKIQAFTFAEKHWRRGHIASLVMTGVIAALFLFWQPIEFQIAFAVVLLFLAALNLKWTFRYHPFRLILARDPAAVDPDEGEIIDAAHVDAILIREGEGRRGADDRRVQVLIHIAPEDRWEMVFQSYYLTRNNAIKTTQRLANWLNESRG